MFFGIALVVIGLVFLLQNLGFISNNIWDIIWPSLIILLGVSILMKEKKKGGKWKKIEEGMDKVGEGIRKTVSGKE